jgi:hypothetical protein
MMQVAQNEVLAPIMPQVEIFPTNDTGRAALRHFQRGHVIFSAWGCEVVLNSQRIPAVGVLYTPASAQAPVPKGPDDHVPKDPEHLVTTPEPLPQDQDVSKPVPAKRGSKKVPSK